MAMIRVWFEDKDLRHFDVQHCVPYAAKIDWMQINEKYYRVLIWENLPNKNIPAYVALLLNLDFELAIQIEK